MLLRYRVLSHGHAYSGLTLCQLWINSPWWWMAWSYAGPTCAVPKKCMWDQTWSAGHHPTMLPWTSTHCSRHCVWPRFLAQVSNLVSTVGKVEVAERGQVNTVCPWGQAVCSATFPSLPWLLCVGLNWFNRQHHQRLPMVHEHFRTVLLDCVWTHRQVTSSGTGSSEVCDKVRHKPDSNEPLFCSGQCCPVGM